jgi:AHBA synthesis associated protein
MTMSSISAWHRQFRTCPVRTVIFDLDGVLIDSFEVMRAAFEFAHLEVVGTGEPPFTEYMACQGMYFPDIMRRIGLPLEMEQPYVEASARLVDRVKVYPGVPELLSQLRRQGINTAVATGKSVARACQVLDALNLLPLLDTVVGSDQVASPKPSPDIVLEALHRLQSPASEAVMVGDAVTDIRSGSDAGVRTIAVTWGETDPALLLAERPDLIVGSLPELEALLLPRVEVTS